MPAKLDRCVDDLKAKGKNGNPWAICNSSVGQKESSPSAIKEKINANRQVPVFNPPIKKGKVEPSGKKSKHGIGGMERKKQNAVLWKDIFDSQIKRNVKEPKV